MMIRVVLFAISIIMILRISGNIRSKNGRMFETFLWLAVWAFLGIVAIVPDVTSFLATIFGVGRGVDLAIYLGIILLYYLIFKIYVRIERMERDLTKLVRKIAVDNPVRKKE